jgi:hypothetical protein
LEAAPWSWIAFYSERNGNAETSIMNADGTQQRRVTHDPWYDQAVRWEPPRAQPYRARAALSNNPHLVPADLAVANHQFDAPVAFVGDFACLFPSVDLVHVT